MFGQDHYSHQVAGGTLCENAHWYRYSPCAHPENHAGNPDRWRYPNPIWQKIMAEDDFSPYDKLFDEISRNYDHFNDFYKTENENDLRIFHSSDFNNFIKEIKIPRKDELWRIINQSKGKSPKYLNENFRKIRNEKSIFLSKIQAYNWLLLPLIIDNKPQGLIFVDNKLI